VWNKVVEESDMINTGIWKRFIDKTARRPEGKWAIKKYNNPTGHYASFKIIIEALCLNGEDAYCEIGCGGGVLLNMAMSKVKAGAAIDHSSAMVELSIKNNRRYVEEGTLEIVQGKAEELPWEDERFTACASANMFFFVEDPYAMLAEAFRVLRPGGRFSMVTVGSGLLGKIIFGWLYALKTYSNIEMISMFRSAGFSGIQVKSTRGLLQVCYGEKLC
jgi:ubiquinone/menaquinone biosynthesis C-methylase UbiE